MFHIEECEIPSIAIRFVDMCLQLEKDDALFKYLVSLFVLLCEEEVPSSRDMALRWTALAFILWHFEHLALPLSSEVLMTSAGDCISGLIEMAVADADRLIVECGGFDDALKKSDQLMKCTRQIIGNVTRLEKIIEVLASCFLKNLVKC